MLAPVLAGGVVPMLDDAGGGVVARCCRLCVSEGVGRTGAATGRGANGELGESGLAIALGPILLGLLGAGVGVVLPLAVAGTTGRGANGCGGVDMRKGLFFCPPWRKASPFGKAKSGNESG